MRSSSPTAASTRNGARSRQGNTLGGVGGGSSSGAERGRSITWTIDRSCEGESAAPTGASACISRDLPARRLDDNYSIGPERRQAFTIRHPAPEAARLKRERWPI